MDRRGQPTNDTWIIKVCRERYGISSESCCSWKLLHFLLEDCDSLFPNQKIKLSYDLLWPGPFFRHVTCKVILKPQF